MGDEAVGEETIRELNCKKLAEVELPKLETLTLNNIPFCLFLSLFKKQILFIILEREERREKDRERNINVWLPLKYSLLGTWPSIQAGGLTGNRTSDPLVCRLALSPLSHTSQGCLFSL